MKPGNGSLTEGRMNLELLIPVLILAPCAAYGLARLPEMWTEKAVGARPKDTGRRWSFHDAWQEGWARSFPASILALTALVLSMAAVLVEEATSGTLSELAGRSALGAFILFVSFTLAAVSVTLFNRPKLLVPPVARDESGAFALWWRGRRRSRRSRRAGR
jgi:hypothetical protein